MVIYRGKIYWVKKMYEYEHTGVDEKGVKRTFWSHKQNDYASCFDGFRWLKGCQSTGKSRKYQEKKVFLSGNSYAFWH